MDLDQVLKKYIGEFGRYQLLILLFISIEESFIAFQVLSPVFVVGTPRHWCSIPNSNSINCTQDDLLHFAVPRNKDGKYSSCELYQRNFSAMVEAEVCPEELSNMSSVTPNPESESEPHERIECEFWEYDKSLYTNTMVTEWNLVCGKQYLAASVSAVTFAAFVTGCAIFGFVSDWQGRKPVILGTGVLHVLFGVAIGFAPNFEAVLGLRFFQMCFGAAKTTMALPMILEFVGPSRRVVASVVYFLYWVSALLLLPVLAYIIRDWRTLQIVITAPEIIYYFIFFFIIPESPRWLLVKHKRQKAYGILRNMAKVNQTVFPDDISVTESNKKIGTALDLVRTPAIRRATLNIFFCWCAVNFVYYGLSLNTANIGGNPYINFLIAAAMELPSYLMLIPTLKYLGRVYTYSIAMLLAGTSLITVILIPSDMVWGTVAAAMIGKCCVSTSFILLMYYTMEVYPTEIRSIGITTANVPGRCSAILASYVGLLAANDRSLPLVVFGAVSVLSGMVALVLPETRGAPLHQTVAQGEAFIKQHEGRKYCCKRRSKKKKVPTATLR